MNRIVIG